MQWFIFLFSTLSFGPGLPNCCPGLPNRGPGVNRLRSQITKIMGPEYHFLALQWVLLSKYRASGKMNPRGHVSALGATFQDQLALMVDLLLKDNFFKALKQQRKTLS